MNPFGSSSRSHSSEFERISLDDLSARRPDPQRPQLNIVPPAEEDVPQPSTLSPSRPIIIPRVSLRRNDTSTSAKHWRKPSYSRVDSSTNRRTDPSEPAQSYDDEGVEPDIQEVREGLNAALGTETQLGSWLPTTRLPSFRRTENTLAPPQIVVEDTASEEASEPDERETAGLAANAGQIAGAPSIRRTGQQPALSSTDMLGPDLSTLERRGSDTEHPLAPTSPGGNSVIRHLRKTSQRIVNITNADEPMEEGTEYSFPGASHKRRPSTQEGPQEFPFPTVGPRRAPSEKFRTHTEFSAAETGHSARIDTVEFRGKSLGIFGPNSTVRNRLCNLLLHPATEPVIFVVIIIQTIFLTIQAAPNVEEYPQTLIWGQSWVDYGLLAVFVFYTAESIIRIIVSGFFINPLSPEEQYRKEIGPRPTAIVLQRSGTRSRSKSPSPIRKKDALKRQYSTSAVRRLSLSRSGITEPLDAPQLRRQYTILRTHSPGPLPERGRQHAPHSSHLHPHRPDPSQLEYRDNQPDYQAPIFTAVKIGRAGEEQAQTFRNRHKARLAHRAYLRHSFNRMDFIAVVSYWIALILELTEIMSRHHIYVFRMLSCLRIFRLLAITEGTSVVPQASSLMKQTILRSLKKAAPLLVPVAFFIGFFWVIFAIIGIQTFRGSFRRQCVWVDPLGIQPNYTQQLQFCGGYLDPVDFTPRPYITASGVPNTEAPKGFLCPVQSLCVEQLNPYNNTVSFDNFFQSMELVFVIISANTFTDLMYYTIDAEFMVASLYFVIGIVVLAFWLINLVIAVITSSFQVTREESQHSAFMSKRQENLIEATEDLTEPRPLSSAQLLFEKTKLIWVGLIVVDLVIQAMRTSRMGPTSLKLLSVTETVMTIIFDTEIIVRFFISLPDWRTFFYKKSNCVDLFLAVATSIIQIPPIHNSGVYRWLTIFQILRVYRVIIAIPVTRNLLSKVLSNAFGLSNLLIFLFMITFFCGILACQLIRGDIPTVDQFGNQYEISFRTVWNAFLGMYQILSSENWTAILYSVTEFQTQYHVAWISATFLICWLIVSNIVILSMFIAVIQENIGVTEEEKRKEQVRTFIEKAVPTLQKTEIHGNLTMSSIFRRKKKEPLFESGPEAFNLLMKEAVVKEFLDEQENNRPPPITLQEQHEEQMKEQSSFVGRIKIWFRGTRIHRALGQTFRLYPDQRFSFTPHSVDPNQMAQDALIAHAKQIARQTDFLKSNPRANKSLWIFAAHNPIRRVCQLMVAPSRGERIEGMEPNPIAWWCFSAITYVAIVCIVVLACITTPLYQINYFAEHGDSRFNWVSWSDVAFAIIFTIEAIIKIVADGFLLTPNAYIRNVWNDIDFFVLLTLWINVVADLTSRGNVSRAFRACKALRALRLANISETARQTFHDLIISGFWNIISAAFVAMSLLIPYAIWGLNIFNGLMFSCNDTSPGMNKTLCIGEYNSLAQNWNLWAPRAWANPEFYNFDNFGSSLAILFEIVSEEGWINVLTSAMAIVGLGQNPIIDASPLNAIFFVVFNIGGAVFVLTLFISVILTNYLKRCGIAYMTAEQRSWQELRKVLLQLRPSKRPAERPDRSWRAWCFDRAISKHGYWYRFMTVVYCVHVILLAAEIYPSPEAYNVAQNYAFLGLSMIYVFNIVIRLVGLGAYNFVRSLWDIYDLVIVTGVIATTITMLAQVESNTFIQFQKLFLVAIAFNLIPRNDALDQLFKTAASSLPSIASLLCIWMILFVVYAIAMTQIFGLTRLGPNGRDTLNFRTIPNALVVLFRMSLGEGWNQIMADYTVTAPQCVSDPDFFKNDCGSPPWAYGLFISWNILSMYIFSNMLLTVVFENFSYVYQRAGKLRLFTREEIRRFKKTWAKFDKHATGFIHKDQLPRFLSQLRGMFEVRIYNEYHSVHTIIQQCRKDFDPTKVHAQRPMDIDNIDLHLLRNSIDRLPVEEIRERRRSFNILYEEAMMSADDERGISFTAMLLMLAHHKFIDDNKALSLDEFLRRRAKMLRVADQVNEKVVRGFFQTLYWRRAFLNQRSSTNASYAGVGKLHYHKQANNVVPSIVVEASESNLSIPARTALPSLDLTQMRRDMGTGYSEPSPTDWRGRLQPSPTQRSDTEDGTSPPGRTWSSIGGPDSQIATSMGTEFSQPMDENEASQVAQSLSQSVWGDAIRRSPTRSHPRPNSSDG